MSAAYVRGYYDVDYRIGDRVTVDGRPGVIVSFPGAYLGVRFDGETITSRAHPTWRVERIDSAPLSSRAVSAQYRRVCTTCGAQPCQPCRTLTTGRVTDAHAARLG
jgi:hypothetical protein